MRGWWVVLVLAATAAPGDELERAERLAWNKQFAEAEAIYRAAPPSRRAQLGLARVVMWSGRYGEAISLFDALLEANPRDVDALEGRATSEYWSGDFRSAARDFRRVLELDPKRDFARTSLSEIHATMRPSQRMVLGGQRDDQPLDVHRGEIAASFYSDPLTRWTVVAGAMNLETERRGSRRLELVRVEGETQWRGLGLSGAAGVLDGGFIGGAAVWCRLPACLWGAGRRPAPHDQLSLRVERQAELASATGIRANAFSTTTVLRWSRERPNLIAAAEASRRNYSDDNSGHALIAYAVVPWKRGAWTLWGGGSVAARDTRETRFHPTAVSSTLEQTFFRYRYRGEYDPYWTPDDLLEVRAVAALERELGRGRVKLHADAGIARDRGRSFGPDAGIDPFPPQILTFTFDRDYHPYRFGLSTDFALTQAFRIEAGVERSVTVDYRSTAFHAALVRRR